MKNLLRPLLILAAVVVGCVTAAADRPAPFVYPTRCVGCTECTRVCPQLKNGAIAMIRGKAVINPAECVGCNKCAEVCGFNAIKVARPAGGDAQ